MSRFTYKNIVALGLGLKEFDWVEKFIADWQPRLENVTGRAAIISTSPSCILPKKLSPCHAFACPSG